jgi:hypothetical protein
MAGRVLPLELERVREGLFVRPHKDGELLFKRTVSAAPCREPHAKAGGEFAVQGTYLDENFTVFRVHFVAYG